LTSSGQIEVHISLDKERGTLDMEIAIPISVLADPLASAPTSPQPSNGAFIITHQIVLRATPDLDHHVGELQIGDIKIPLRQCEYEVLKTLIETMIRDGISTEKSPSNMGWVSSDELRKVSQKGIRSTRLDPMTYTSSVDLAKCIHQIRNKLSNAGFPRNFLESKGKSYRISAPSSNLTVEPA
jgi:hypothetical protein